MRIKEAREKLGMSQAMLAQKVSLSQAFVCEIETGRKQPSLRTALKIAEVLNCSVNDLFSESELEKETEVG